MLDLLAVGRPCTRPACRAATTAIDRYMLRRTSAAYLPTAAAVVDRRDRETGTGPFFEAYRIQYSKPVLVLFLKCISQVKYHFPLQCQCCAERGGGGQFSSNHGGMQSFLSFFVALFPASFTPLLPILSDHPLPHLLVPFPRRVPSFPKSM